MGPSLDDELVQLKRTIDAPGGVLHFWENVLTRQQRTQVGDDVNQAHQRYGGGTGIWVALHGGSVERAIVDVAREMGLIAAAKHRRLLRFLNEQVEATPQGDKPSWDAASGKLFLDGEVVRLVRRYRNPTNVEQSSAPSNKLAGPPRSRIRSVERPKPCTRPCVLFIGASAVFAFTLIRAASS